jgi:preprotein translocase SecE subunit
MATAVETSSQAKAPSASGLLAASLIGAVYVLAAIAVVLYAVPALWASTIGDSLASNTLLEGALKLGLKVVAIGALAWFGSSLLGSNPPKGLRGGIFLIVALVFLIFFVVCGIGTSVSGTTGQVFTAVVGGLMIFAAFKLLTGSRGERWMIALEEQGWFTAKPYKRVLGMRVRRLTILGILLLLGSGIYVMSPLGQNVLKENLRIGLPFTQAEGEPDGTPKMLTLLTDARFTVPVILTGLALWFAFRAVNVPTFAEFLIATEAEMNKVSWTSRKRLAQDTVVVLVTTILMALFLLLVDLFWGWLLSTSWVGVLPPKSTNKDKAGQVEAAKW